MSRNLSQQWLDRASEDLVVANLVLKENYPAHACFLSQQCIEKCLKSYLLKQSNQYPRTHRLVDLIGECARHNQTFLTFLPDVTVVDQYYIPTRYPDAVPGSLPGGLPGKDEATEAIEIADRILTHTRQQM